MKILATLVLLNGIAAAQSPTSVVGVWKVSHVVTTGPTAMTITDPQPSVYIFTKGYYSAVIVRGDKARADLSEKPTDAELAASAEPLTANAGTYEISGNTLTSHVIVAKSPNYMHAGSMSTWTIKGDGKTLTMTSATNQSGPVPNPVTVTLTRLE
ncbi:MAG: hypothetical protein NVSMB62_01260 [Acidobacteriaceae bacterium]